MHTRILNLLYSETVVFLILNHIGPCDRGANLQILTLSWPPCAHRMNVLWSDSTQPHTTAKNSSNIIVIKHNYNRCENKDESKTNTPLCPRALQHLRGQRKHKPHKYVSVPF